MAFPTTLPSYTVTAGGETANGAGGGTGLSGLLNAFETDLVALGTKAGTGASVPAANTLFYGTGAGTSAWQGLTSAQLAAVLSDETGTGKAVFGTSPVIVTPTIADFTNMAHNHSNAAGGGQLSASAFPNNAITAALLATNAILLGSATATTTFSTSSTSPVQITGLSLTVTVPAGGRSVAIVVWCGGLYNSVAASNTTMSLFDGAIGGTQLGQVYGIQGGSSSSGGIILALQTPGAGSKTYNVGLRAGANTASAEAGSNYPALLMAVLL